MTDPRTSTLRPAVVTASSYLLYAAAAITLLSSLLALTTIGLMSDVYEDVLGTSSDEASLAITFTVAAVAVNVLIAGGLVVLALLNNRAKNPARIVTWVIGGIYLCCSGFGLAGTALTGSLDTGSGTGVSAQEVDRRLSAELPGWYNPVSTTAGVLIVLCVLAALILLALPAANAFFRTKAAGGWDPSQPYPYPGQPPYPGMQQQPYQPFPNSSSPTFPGPPAQSYPPAQSGPPAQSYPPAQPYPPSQSPPPAQPYPPAQSGSPAQSYPPAGSGPPAGQPPHTGSIPLTDPWSAPTREDKPPSDPTAPS